MKRERRQKIGIVGEFFDTFNGMQHFDETSQMIMERIADCSSAAMLEFAQLAIGARRSG